MGPAASWLREPRIGPRLELEAFTTTATTTKDTLKKRMAQYSDLSSKHIKVSSPAPHVVLVELAR